MGVVMIGIGLSGFVPFFVLQMVVGLLGLGLMNLERGGDRDAPNT